MVKLIFFPISFILFLSSSINCSFQFDLFQKIASQNENETVFLSPLSLLESLYLTASTSTPHARKEILGLLGLKNLKQLDKLLKQINSKLTSSSVSNQLFSKVDLKEEYISFLISINANSTKLTKAKQVNAWCSKSTQAKIPKIIGNVQTVDMLTITSLFINGTWRYPFDVSQTSPYSFTNNLGDDVPVDFMSASFDNIGFFKNDKLQMIELPYADSDISTIIIIPAIDVNDLLKAMNENMINRYIRRMEKKKIKIALPKCNIDTQISLSNALKELGMKAAFELGSDSSVSDTTLNLGSFTAKTKFEFNELGSTVANVNYEVYNGISEPEAKEADLILSRPFIVVMKHNKIDNYFLLIGKVSNLE